MDFNLGKNQTKDMMPYVRMAIERYLYERLGENLFAIYAFKNRKDDERFAARQAELLAAYEINANGRVE